MNVLKFLAFLLFLIGAILAIFVKGVEGDALWALLFGGLASWALSDLYPITVH